MVGIDVVDGREEIHKLKKQDHLLFLSQLAASSHFAWRNIDVSLNPAS